VSTKHPHQVLNLYDDMVNCTDLIVLQVLVELVHPLPDGFDVSGQLRCLRLCRNGG
jgi:hypothetical protein